MKGTNRQQILIIGAVVAIVFYLSDLFIITPLTATWKDRAKKINDLNRSIQQGQLVLARDHIINQQWNSMRTNTLPENQSAAEDLVVKAFYNWAETSHINLSSVKSQWTRNNEDYMLLDCRADASGSMEALTRFLYDLEKDPLALRVEGVEITARDAGGQQLTLSVQVTGLLIAKEEDR